MSSAKEPLSKSKLVQYDSKSLENQTVRELARRLETPEMITFTFRVGAFPIFLHLKNA
jgi:hypothetical protein